MYYLLVLAHCLFHPSEQKPDQAIHVRLYHNPSDNDLIICWLIETCGTSQTCTCCTSITKKIPRIHEIEIFYYKLRVTAVPPLP